MSLRILDKGSLNELQPWLLHALTNTDRCDRQRAEDSVSKLYELKGLKPPEFFFWCASPVKATIAACLFAWMAADYSCFKPHSRSEYVERMAAAHDEPTPLPLVYAWRDKIAYIEQSGDDICLAHKMFRPPDVRLLNMNSPVPHLANEFMPIAMNAGDNLRRILEEAVFREMIEWMGRGYALDFWLDTFEEILVKARGHHAFDYGLRRAGELLWLLNTDEHRMVINHLLQFIISTDRHYQLLSGWDTFIRGINPKLRYGQHELDRIALQKLSDISLVGQSNATDALAEVSTTVNWWFPFANACLMVERPVVMQLDDGGRLHNVDEMAIKYEDGFGLYAMRGIPVDERVAKGKFRARDIDEENNVERRRIMIERFGTGKYLQETGAKLLQEDRFGKLYIKGQFNDESIVMVELVNSSPEPDGTYKNYLLRVPPNTRSAREAVAWTFGMDDDQQYHPVVET